MSFDLRLAVTGGLRAHYEAALTEVATGLFEGTDAAGNEVKALWRKQVLGGNLGQRLANTVRHKVYPRRQAKSLSPAATVYTNAPHILGLHAEGGTIKVRGDGGKSGKAGLYLWIPTENVTMRRRKGRSLADMVDSQTELDIIPSGKPGVFFAVATVIKSRSKRGWVRPTAKRTTAGRETTQVVMFILVRQVTMRRRYDFGAVAQLAQTQGAVLVASHVARRLTAQERKG